MLIVYGLVFIAVCMDLCSMRISNRLILIGLGIALLQRFLSGGMIEVLNGIILTVVPIILLYLLFLVGALGAGDIKLFSLIGGFVNFKILAGCIFYAFLFAGVGSFLKMVYHRTLFSSLRNVSMYWQNICMGYRATYSPAYGKKSKIHFSISILCGLLISQVVCG